MFPELHEARREDWRVVQQMLGMDKAAGVLLYHCRAAAAHALLCWREQCHLARQEQRRYKEGGR